MEVNFLLVGPLLLLLASSTPPFHHFPHRSSQVLAHVSVWALTEYKRVVFLADNMLVVENIDDLFECPGICAGESFVLQTRDGKKKNSSAEEESKGVCVSLETESPRFANGRVNRTALDKKTKYQCTHFKGQTKFVLETCFTSHSGTPFKMQSISQTLTITQASLSLSLFTRQGTCLMPTICERRLPNDETL